MERNSIEPLILLVPSMRSKGINLSSLIPLLPKKEKFERNSRIVMMHLCDIACNLRECN